MFQVHWIQLRYFGSSLQWKASLLQDGLTAGWKELIRWSSGSLRLVVILYKVFFSWGWYILALYQGFSCVLLFSYIFVYSPFPFFLPFLISFFIHCELSKWINFLISIDILFCITFYSIFLKTKSDFIHLQGKVKYKETVVKGFDKMPEAFIGLFHGENTGKAIVAVWRTIYETKLKTVYFFII